MPLDRRQFLTSVGAGLVAAGMTGRLWAQGEDRMHGMIGRITAVEGQRDALIEILLEGVSGMPGCLSYVVAKDPADLDGIWITEVWDSQANHQASLELPAVRDAIARGKPMITSFDQHIVTRPVGGHGLTQADE